MTQFLRSGYYEYDKRKVRPLKKCGACGCDIAWGVASRKFCGPCYDARQEQLLAARRSKYRGRIYGKRKEQGTPSAVIAGG